MRALPVNRVALFIFAIKQLYHARYERDNGDYSVKKCTASFDDLYDFIRDDVAQFEATIQESATMSRH
jgi:hypothetical protein